MIDDGLESEANRAKPNYDATKDVLSVEFGHVAENRYLWRWTVAENARPEDTVFHLYVDADADNTTGRKTSPGAPNHGTDYMVTVAGGSPRITAYAPDGNTLPGPPLTYVVEGNQIILSCDIDLARDNDGIKFGLYMLCHTSTGSGDGRKMSDSSRKIDVRGMPVRPGKKILRPRDHKSNFLVDAAFGTETLQRALADKKNIVIPYNKLDLDGYEIDPFATRKWPYVARKTGGAVARTTAPKPGKYHVGFMMYDAPEDERIVLSVDGKIRGVAVARLGTRRTWLYWLREAIDFSGGESVELKAVGAGGKHGIAYVVFLADPPEASQSAAGGAEYGGSGGSGSIGASHALVDHVVALPNTPEMGRKREGSGSQERRNGAAVPRSPSRSRRPRRERRLHGPSDRRRARGRTLCGRSDPFLAGSCDSTGESRERKP